MNIKVQACGFVLLVILYLLYHQQHTLQTYSRRAFLRFYAVTVLCILMDILSIVAIESASHLPALFVTFVCKTYLITLVLTALCGVMYIGVDILLSNKAFRKTEHLILLITSVICLSIYLLPISIYCDPVTHIVYTYGSSALMTYLGAVGLILLNFALILKYCRQIRVRRRTGMLLWMLVWILSAIIQFLNPEILVVGFGSCLGVVIIYLCHKYLLLLCYLFSARLLLTAHYCICLSGKPVLQDLIHALPHMQPQLYPRRQTDQKRSVRYRSSSPGLRRAPSYDP